MGRPPQNSKSSIWSSSGSICQLRDTTGWSASGLAISTVLSIGAVWNLTGRRVSGSQEDEGSSGGAQRCTNGKPHIVVLSVTQLPLSCDWGGNTLSNLSAARYCRGLSITPQAAKLSIGIASSEAPENFSGAYRSGGFRQHHRNPQRPPCGAASQDNLRAGNYLLCPQEQVSVSPSHVLRPVCFWVARRAVRGS